MNTVSTWVTENELQTIFIIIIIISVINIIICYLFWLTFFFFPYWIAFPTSDLWCIAICFTSGVCNLADNNNNTVCDMFAAKINVVIIFSQVAIVRGVMLFSLLGNTSFITRSSAERSPSLPLWTKEMIPASVPLNLTIFFHSQVQVKKINLM